MSKGVLGLIGLGGKDDSELRGYGTISTSFFSYITPKMVLVLATPVAFVALNFALVEEYFLAGEKLNFIILTVFMMGIVKATYNNFVVRKNAKYIKAVSYTHLTLPTKRIV